MAWAECKAIIEAAAGREFTSEEIAQLTDAAEMKLTAKMRRGMSKRDATAALREEVSREALLQALIARRSAYINKLVWEDLKGMNTLGREAKAVIATLSGVSSGSERGFASSVWATYHGIRNGEFIGPMKAQLEKAGVLRAAVAGDKALDRDVARELYRRLMPESGTPTGNSVAVKIAEVLGSMQEVARLRLNGAGAWVAKIDNYIARQSHDPVKIQRASRDTWKRDIFGKLDAEKTFGEGASAAEIDDKLNDIYNALVTGVHDTTGNEVLRAFGGPGSRAKKVSQSRSLIFRDADSWVDYNEKYGRGGVMDSVIASMDRAARDIALMERFGTNPQFMFERWVRDLEVQAKDDGGRKMGKGFFQDSRSLGDLFDTVSGFSSSPGNHTIASVGTFVRDLQQLSKLGAVFISALPDLVATAATLRHNGVSFWGAMAGQLSATLPSGAERREVASMLGAGIDNSMGAMIHRFREGDEVTGKLSRAVGMFHKLNLLAPWTEAMKEGVALSLSHNLAFHSAKTFDALPERMQRTLRRYGIEAAEWDVGRAASQRALDGRNYILPSAIEDQKVASAFRTYIVDQIREGLTEPTARVRTILAGGTQSGTLVGETIRTITQFKSFSASFMERHLGREFSRNGVDVPGVIALAVGMTSMGMASLMLKELAAGRTFTWPEDPRQATALFTKAFLQGGAGGLIADSLMRDPHGVSGGLIESLAGPTAGTVEDAAKVVYDTIVGDGKGRRGRDEILAKGLLPFMVQNTPGANLLWTKAMTEYLFIYGLQEQVNPGYLRRFEKKVEDSGRAFLLRPSESAAGIR